VQAGCIGGEGDRDGCQERETRQDGHETRRTPR
jgi:hypothetical protein